MTESNLLIAQKTILINAPVEMVRRFIKTPSRILDYYPGGNECGELKGGRYFYCKGLVGVSLLEVTKDEPQGVYLKVWTAAYCSSPYTVEKLKKNAFFIMEEDWQLESKSDQTQLIKSWLNLKKIKLRFLPVAWIVRKSVKKECQLIAEKWGEYP